MMLVSGIMSCCAASMGIRQVSRAFPQSASSCRETKSDNLEYSYQHRTFNFVPVCLYRRSTKATTQVEATFEKTKTETSETQCCSKRRGKDLQNITTDCTCNTKSNAYHIKLDCPVGNWESFSSALLLMHDMILHTRQRLLREKRTNGVVLVIYCAFCRRASARSSRNAR